MKTGPCIASICPLNRFTRLCALRLFHLTTATVRERKSGDPQSHMNRHTTGCAPLSARLVQTCRIEKESSPLTAYPQMVWHRHLAGVHGGRSALQRLGIRFLALPTALLVFFPASTRAWIVPSGLLVRRNRFDRWRKWLIVITGELFLVILFALLAVVKTPRTRIVMPAHF